MRKQRNTIPSTDRRAIAIQQLLDSACSFALYRRPGQQQVELMLQTTGHAQPVPQGDTELDGFLFAPFHSTSRRPALLLHAEHKAVGWDAIALEAGRLPRRRPRLSQLTHRHAEALDVLHSTIYTERYSSTINQIRSGHFEKLVLSYCQQHSQPKLHLLGQEARIFLRALETYPHAMVYLFYSPQSGRWMGCTPELLLERQQEQWSTMSLAGTRIGQEGEWDTKNVLEQDVVTRYLLHTLQEMGASVQCTACGNLQIGNLLHIRTDVAFRFPHPVTTTTVAQALHPTPAVCGFPKQKAYRYLVSHERASRNYFSGYLGPVHGQEEAHLYVNLRCAQIGLHNTYYHAGGGITALSQLPEERQEIARKLDILKGLTGTHK